MSRATGYRVLRKHRKHGDILVCGFPANQLDMVLQRIREAIYKRVMKLSEGDSGVYNFEDFTIFDAPIREAYKQQNAARRAQGQSASKKRIESRPPIIHKGTWRDAGKIGLSEYTTTNN